MVKLLLCVREDIESNLCKKPGKGHMIDDCSLTSQSKDFVYLAIPFILLVNEFFPLMNGERMC